MSKPSVLNRFKGELILLFAAMIWGSAFVFQKMGMDHIGPYAFSFFRFFLGAMALLPVIYVLDKSARKRNKPVMSFTNRELLKYSIILGVISTVASLLQQVGIIYTTAGKSGFITTLYIIFVPLVLLVFYKKHVAKNVWVAVFIAAIGLYLLCIKEGFSIGIGDGLTLMCAIAYGFQIVFVDIFVERVDAVKLSFLQFLVIGIISFIMMLMFEEVEIQGIIDCTIPILYTAILEVSIAFTLQLVGQKYAPPTSAAIIMSFESVFACLSGMVVLGEMMSSKEITGAVLLFVAVILSQIPMKNSEEPQNL